jgi:hypothetical protein
MVEDIRSAPAEGYWEKLREMMGEDGLMTYRYLGRTVNTFDDDVKNTMVLRRDMRNDVGGIMAAPLAIAAPETGGFTDKETIPAPVTYALHVLDDARDVREVRIVHTTLHAGRNMAFGQSMVVDADNPDRVIALARGTGIKLGTAPPGFQEIDHPPVIEDSPDLPPLPVAFGARRRADGQWELPELNPKHASTSASLHLGPIHVVLEAAAVDLATDRAGGAVVQVEEWNVLYVAPGTVGPFVVTGDAVSGSLGGRVLCNLTLSDEGRGGRIVTSASAVFRPAD